MTDHDDTSSGGVGPEPLAITRIDIFDQDDGGAALIIWAGDRDERVLIRFTTRREALDYCRAIWERRQDWFESHSDDEQN